MGFRDSVLSYSDGTFRDGGISYDRYKSNKSDYKCNTYLFHTDKPLVSIKYNPLFQCFHTIDRDGRYILQYLQGFERIR